MPTTNLWRFASATFVALVLALAAAGCSSSSALKPDASTGQGGRDAGAGTTGAAGSTGGVGAGAGGGAAGAGAGTAGTGGGAAGAGGAGGAGGALGYCDKDEDCVFHSVCCGGTCNAKTDPAAPPMVCATACAINLGPSTCGCVNHKCSSASTCIVPGSGLCPYCPNGYLKGATGCQTCECASTDAGTNADGAGADASVHSLGEACDDGGGCTSGLVCKAIGDPCPTYPKCNRCYRPCGDGGACPLSQRCIPPAGQGGDVCL